MSTKEQYQQEQIQSEIDHHSPTAGAMTTHVISNLMVQRIKLFQAKYFLRGASSYDFKNEVNLLIWDLDSIFDDLNQTMIEEGEAIPTTINEFSEFKMLEEQPEFKFEDAETIISSVIMDFRTQLLFVTKAITLADLETKYALKNVLVKLYDRLKSGIFNLQAILGYEVREDEEE